MMLILSIHDDAQRALMEKIYNEQHALIFAAIRRVLGSTDEAEDVLSEVILALIEKIEILTELSCPELRGYVYSTSKRVAIAHLRKRMRRRGHRVDAADELLARLPSGEAGPDERLQLGALVDQLGRCIGALTPGEREVLEMHCYLKMTDEEIAGALGIQADSVRRQLARARVHLRELMAEDDREVET